MTEWERCRPWIEAALEHQDTHGIEDIERLVESGHAQFWPGRRCAVVTEVVSYPRYRALCLWLAGGDLDDLVALSRCIAAWGRAKGASRLVINGRPGWARALRRHGFTLRHVVAREI